VIHFATYRTLLGEPFQTAGSNEATVFFVLLITMFMYYTNGVQKEEINAFVRKFTGREHTLKKKKSSLSQSGSIKSIR
jgi:hypothetical protein